MYVIEWMRSFCTCEKEIEFDDDTIEVLKAIYHEQNPHDWESDEEDSEDEDYEPPPLWTHDSESSESESESEPDDDPDSDQDEEIIVKRNSEGHYYLY